MRLRFAKAVIACALFMPLFSLSAQFCPTSNDAWYPPFTLVQRAKIAQEGEDAIASAFPKGYPPLAAILMDEHGILWWSAHGGADEASLFEMEVFSSALDRLGLMLKADGKYPDLTAFIQALDLEGFVLPSKSSPFKATVQDLATIGLVLAMDGEFKDRTVIAEAVIRKVGFDWRFRDISPSGWTLAYTIDPRSRLVAVAAGWVINLPPPGGMAAFYDIPNRVLAAALSFR